MGFMGIIIATSPKRFTGENTFYYYLLIVDAQFKNPKNPCDGKN